MNGHDPLCPDGVLRTSEGCWLCDTLGKARADERRKVVGTAVWELTVDDAVNMAYLMMSPDLGISGSYTTIHRDAYLDLDPSGRVVGMEIFDWPSKRQNSQHKFVMDPEFEMCIRCGALLDSIYQDGIHWFKKEGDNG